MAEACDPATLLCGGPWVFAGREADFADWEQRFTFAPEPFATTNDLVQAGQMAMQLSAQYLPKLARTLAPASQLPGAYWETLLIPWLGVVSQQIVERWLRIKVIVEHFAAEPLVLPLLPDDLSFHFQDENDLVLRGSLGLTFNHWLFSWLLRRMKWPEIWKEVPAKAISEDLPVFPKPGISQRLRRIISRSLLKLPFPRLKGLSLWQSLRLSLALSHPSHGTDQSRSLATLCKDFSASTLPDFDLLPVFLRTIPSSLKELKHPKKIAPVSAPRLYVASISAYEDSRYRQRLARLRGQGHRLMFIQHGGNYGQIKSPCLTRMFEFQQHVFGTWGWQSYEEVRGHFLPLPYPQLARIANAHEEKNAQLIFVGTEMPLFGYRLDCRPSPLQTILYRKAKETFFATLGEELTSQTLYRPYFPLPSSLADADWLLPRFPQLKLCQGPLWPSIRSCRLLVLDHHGTTLLEAMAANIPLLVTFCPEHWPLTRKSQDMFQILERAGIYFADAHLCAQKARHIWPNIQNWWQSSDVQNARQMFCREYALTIPGDTTSYLASLCKTL